MYSDGEVTNERATTQAPSARLERVGDQAAGNQITREKEGWKNPIDFSEIKWGIERCCMLSPGTTPVIVVWWVHRVITVATRQPCMCETSDLVITQNEVTVELEIAYK